MKIKRYENLLKVYYSFFQRHLLIVSKVPRTMLDIFTWIVSFGQEFYKVQMNL